MTSPPIPRAKLRPHTRSDHQIKAYVKELFNAGLIDQTELTYMTPHNPTQTQFMYFLRKIHQTPHQIRPIVSKINGPTCNISSFLDHFFKPLLSEIPSYLKDTKHLTQLLSSTNIDQPEKPS